MVALACEVENWPQVFGEENVVELLRREGNPMFARGAFGEISIGLFTSDANNIRLVAIKTILQSTMSVGGGINSKMMKRKLIPDVHSEIKSLHELCPHRNIVQLLALFQAKDEFPSESLNLVFEYCPIDLYLALEWRRRSVLPLICMDTIRTIALDLFAALDHCHSHNIIHLDVKPGNLLMSSSGDIKLADFGLAKSISKTDNAVETSTRGMCTLYYRPPELLLGGQSDHPAIDIYSAGLVLAELLSGNMLFVGVNDLDQLGKIFECLGSPTDENWPEAKDLPHGSLSFTHHNALHVSEYIPRATESPGLVEFIQSCLVIDPKKRITSSKALQHTWFQNGLTTPRYLLHEEIIPRTLDEPFVFRTPEGDLSIAKNQALAIAGSRKIFLKSLDTWSK